MQPDADKQNLARMTDKLIEHSQMYTANIAAKRELFTLSYRLFLHDLHQIITTIHTKSILRKLPYSKNLRKRISCEKGTKPHQNRLNFISLKNNTLNLRREG